MALLTKEYAKTLADDLNREEQEAGDNWRYEAVDHGSKYAVVLVYDGDENLLGEL